MSIHTRLKVLKHTLDDIREAQTKFKYVFITDLEKFYFPFDTYQSGVYHISLNGTIYQVKDPSFLYVNNLTIKND